MVIDYVQLIRNDEKGLNSVERIGEASEGCLAIAKGLGVPVVLLAQINREGGQRKKLSMSDLKGSGKLEEDAVQIVLMSRPGQNNPDEPPERVIIDLAKNRHGATTEQELYFDMQFSRFEVAR